MKLVLATALLVLSTSAFAENWLPHSKVLAGSVEAFQLKATCEKVSGERCYDLGNNPAKVYSEVTVVVDDEARPIYSKEQATTCSSHADCQAKMQALTCTTEGAKAV